MRYMVIEQFAPRCESRVYERAAERGRMLPRDLEYVDSWVDESLQRCFQLMETDQPGDVIERWIAEWSDLARFEVVPVVSSDEVRSGAPLPR